MLRIRNEMYPAATLALAGASLFASTVAQDGYVEAGVGLGSLADPDMAVTNTSPEPPVGLGRPGEASYDAGLMTKIRLLPRVD